MDNKYQDMDKLHINLKKHLDATAIIHYKRDKSSDEIKYKDLLKEILKVCSFLENEKPTKTESRTIGIHCICKKLAITLLCAAIESEFAFCFISSKQIPQDLNKLGIKYFLSDDVLPPNDLITWRNSVEVFGQKLNLYKSSSQEVIKQFNDNDNPLYSICYTILTSGTTGQSKVVRVTYNSILSNIIALQRIFKLNNEVIYSSAPCMFDVFVLDVFLALHSGSALMIMDESLRYSEESLNFMFSSKTTGVTFLQMTPSLFERNGIENIRNMIMNPNSTLK